MFIHTTERSVISSCCKSEFVLSGSKVTFIFCVTVFVFFNYPLMVMWLISRMIKSHR